MAQPGTADDLLRGDRDAVALLDQADTATWQVFEPVWTRPGVDCPPALVRAMVAKGSLLRWVSCLRKAYEQLGDSERAHRAFRRWFAAGVVRHLPPTDLASLRTLVGAISHYVEDDAVARARALVVTIEAAVETQERSLLGRALRALGPTPSEEHRELLGRALLALASHAGDDRDHDVTLAAAVRAEEVFAKLGLERWRSWASRFRAGALLRLTRIDEALVVLEAAFDFGFAELDSDRSSRRTDPTRYLDSGFVLQESDPAARALEYAALVALGATPDTAEWIRALGWIAETTGHRGCAERHEVGREVLARNKAWEEAEAARRHAEGEDIPGPFR